jgi:hypothetical protein
MRFTRHDDVGCVLQWRDREPVGRFHTGLRGDQGPRSDARVSTSRLKGEEHDEKQKDTNGAS